jgi:2-dehydro-3-deoxy-D-arabinonate dehydratase
MVIERSVLPPTPALVRVLTPTGVAKLTLWQNGVLRDLSAAHHPQVRTLDTLLSLPQAQIRAALESPDLLSLPILEPATLELLAPVEAQEVWAAGVTYLHSREARMEEATTKDVYALVYEAERPELFFKAAGWRVVPSGGAVGIRSDSEWDVPEPELAVLSNAAGEVVAYACGNDMSSRSIEGLNPLYLPQAKVYDASCSIGPAAVLAWHVRLVGATIRMTISRQGEELFAGMARINDMVRDPAELVAVLHAAYTLPVGAWLLTGTGIVPPPSYTALPGDMVHISIDGIGQLRNEVKRIVHSGAVAPPRLHSQVVRRENRGEETES